MSVNFNDTEMWKDIPGFIGYQISNKGKVRSCRVKGLTGVCNYNNWHFVIPQDCPDRLGVTRLKVRLNNSEGKRCPFFLHRLLYEIFISPIPSNMCVDHIDRDPKNNELSNLRLATKSQNCINSKPRRGRKYKGVYFNENLTKKWLVQIQKNGKQVRCGRFDTQEEAISVYNKIIQEEYGEFANLNIVSSEVN